MPLFLEPIFLQHLCWINDLFYSPLSILLMRYVKRKNQVRNCVNADRIIVHEPVINNPEASSAGIRGAFLEKAQIIPKQPKEE
jgi:hypothetical protein